MISELEYDPERPVRELPCITCDPPECERCPYFDSEEEHIDRRYAEEGLER